MKTILNQFTNSKTIEKQKSNAYILQESIKKINKNWKDFSVSISGELTFEKINFFCKKLINPDLELF
jgi:hypothetical protein